MDSLTQLVPIHKWPIFPISALRSKFYPRNINHMPPVKFLASLDLEQIWLFLDGHQLTFGAACGEAVLGERVGTVQLLYAGKLNRSKGVPWLLRSLKKITDEDWRLHAAGSDSGPEYDLCIDLARRLPNSYVYQILLKANSFVVLETHLCDFH
jgi:glycosyltransferase involved in cell wall biosynthesis